MHGEEKTMMEKELLNLLHLQREPVGVFLGNASAACDLDASPENTHAWKEIEKRL